MATKVELDIRAQITNLNKGLDRTEKNLKDLQTQSNKTSRTIQGNMNKTNATVTKLTSALGAMLTIGAAVQFTKAIINVRSEFEKYNAVLATALGSARAANREFEKIQRFAAETPFSVRELTDSFVRLVNQGFKPTTKELKLLGDLAASTGKEFIMLTEAIIDAQVGEFERLKEFGIRASKEGDQVTFTFKEVETQVEFTASAIQGYILSLGELEGVTGSMIAISKTLGGQLNNLADGWDNLLDILGEKTGGVMQFVIAQLGGVLNILSDYNELQQGVTENAKEFMVAFAEGLENLSPEEKIAEAEVELTHFNEKYMEMNENIDLFNKVFSKKQIEQFEKLGITYNAITIALSEYIAEQEELIENDVIIVEAKTLESLTKTLKGLQDELKTTNVLNEEAIGITNRKIVAIKEEIKAITDLGVAEDKLKTPKAEELKINEDEIFKIQQELDKEDEQRRKTIDRDIANQRKIAIQQELTDREAAERQKQLLIEGTGEAAIAGLGLLAQFTKDNAEAQQAIAIAQAIINGALGITKTGANLGYPQAIPFQIAQGLQTLAQIAIIRSQKFERGGFDVLKGRRHAQGGVSIGLGEEAEDGEGRSIFSRQAMQKYGKFLPAFTKAINDGTVDTTDGDSYAFNFDDSRSVGKLEAIRELLSKPEVRYENGYRIETRKGQRTKVKV